MIFDLSYVLTALSPLCTGSGSSLGAIHRKVLLDTQGLPLIKGSTLKGTIRYHLTRFLNDMSKDKREGFQFSPPHNPYDLYNPQQGQSQKRSDPIAFLFGTNQIQGRIFFSDARLVKIEGENAFESYYFPLDNRAGTAINRKLGVARKNHLFTLEMVPIGTEFRGKIFGQGRGKAFLLDENDKVPLFLVPLLLGMRLTTHIGSMRSRGLGACRIEPTELKIDDKIIDIRDISKLKDLWEQFIVLFPLRWKENQIGNIQ